MFYVPVLKWKAGEKNALKNLNHEQKTFLLPLIEFTDYQAPAGVMEDLRGCFNHALFVDTINVDEGDRQYLTSLIEESKANDQTLHPVLYLSDFPDLADKLSETSNELLVRLPVPEDLTGPNYSTIFTYLAEWKKQKNITLSLMLDLNVIENRKQANLLYAELKNIISEHLVNNNVWHKIIIALTSFPENLSSVPTGGSASFERLDIRLFEKIYNEENFKTIKGRLLFSDYGVTKFTDSDIDFSKLRYPTLPKAKYTTASEYRVLKGERNHLTKTWVKDYKTIAREIYESEFYYGENFSFGDSEIKERAHGLNKKGPGNSTNWVAINANHHITVVIQELSKIYGF